MPKLGEKTFEQAAGFLRVNDAKEPLDATAIHPESYAVARAALTRAGVKASDPLVERRRMLAQLRGTVGMPKLAQELGAGMPTLTDILDILARPGRDPRSDAPAPVLRSDVLKMEDLAPGMRLKGTVRNVIDFGAFVDIGVKQDGLLHRSQIPAGSTLKVGDVIEVSILRVNGYNPHAFQDPPVQGSCVPNNAAAIWQLHAFFCLDAFRSSPGPTS